VKVPDQPLKVPRRRVGRGKKRGKRGGEGERGE